MAGIYVHVPFCRRKCIYCDFFSVGERLADWSRYVDALIEEGRMRLADDFKTCENFNTIYIGGGTPSLMTEKEFGRLAEFLISLAPDYKEFTIEVNPDDVTAEMAQLWREAGVNRISMGVQSLVDSELKLIGRRHDAAQSLKAYDALRPLFDNISLDLMFGLPTQTLESLCVTLDGLLALRPEHISAYSLMYEERTALTRMVANGKLEEGDENLSVEMFGLLSERLREAGYRQYEISNYALPGRESRHNNSYWRGTPYLGLGPGAHSYDGNRRRTANRPDLRAYMRGDFGALREEEVLTDAELREEMIMTRLRTYEGLDLSEFEERFGTFACRGLLLRAARWLTSGNLAHSDNHLRLTPQSIMISDEIITTLL